MILFATNAIISFSTKPLLISIVMGFTGILVSILLMIYVIHGWLKGGTVLGWASLLVSFTFLQSLTILLIGV
jgi:hypothetical protein